MRGDSLAGLSSGFTLGHEVRGQEVNGDSFTADVLYNISEECINCHSLAWEFGQRRSAGRLRRGWREVAFKFPWSEKGAGAAGDRTWPASGSSAYTYSPGPGRAESQQLHFCSYPNPTPKELGKRMANDSLLKTQSSLQDVCSHNLVICTYMCVYIFIYLLLVFFSFYYIEA